MEVLLLLMPPLLDARTASSYDGRVAYRGTRSKSNKNKKKKRKLNFQESTDINNWAKSTATTKQVGT
jgi:hypothetical protein